MITTEPIRAAECSRPQQGTDYLVSHGKSGAFGRFLAAEPVDLSRGDRVVVRTPRGLELGVVLCRAGGRHLKALEHTPAGQVLRRVTTEDEQAAARLQALAQTVFTDSRRLVAELDLPLEIVDVDVLFDGGKVILQYLNSGPCNAEPVVTALSRTHGIAVLLENVATPLVVEVDAEEAQGGCGKPDCGRSSGGCTSCGSDGGCSSCGSGRVDMKAYFSHLRTQMEEKHRKPLL